MGEPAMWKCSLTVIGMILVHALLMVEADDCPKGFYGPECWRLCKSQSHCLDNDCVLLPSGRALNCSRGCRPGWRGLSCNTNCKHPCIECERYTGECVGACRDGYHGDRCNKNCPQRCVSCKRVSGSCLKCSQGFYGANCSIPCPSECVECDVISGECLNRLNDDASSTAKESEVVRYTLTTPINKSPTGDGLDSPYSEAVDHEVSRNEWDSQTGGHVSSTRPYRESVSLNSTTDSQVITIITGVLVVVCVVVVTLTYMLLFYKRKERHAGPKVGLRDRRAQASPQSQSPFPYREYIHPVTHHAYTTADAWSLCTDHVYPQADGMSSGTVHVSSPSDHVYQELGNPQEDSCSTSHYITPVQSPYAVRVAPDSSVA